MEKPSHLRDDGGVIARQDWGDEWHAARLIGLRAHHGQEADQTGEASLEDGGGSALVGAAGTEPAAQSTSCACRRYRKSIASFRKAL